MKKTISFILTFIMLITPVTSFANKDVTSIEASVVNVVKQYIENNYRFEIDDKEMFDNVIKTVLDKNPELYDDILNSMLSSLDEYSEYYTKEEYDSFYSYVEAEIVGIGAYLENYGDYVIIASVIKDSPAEKAGLMANDIILSADGMSLKNLGTEYAVSVIRGEAGTTVKLEIERNGINMSYSVVRGNVQTKTTASTVLENNVGYIQLANFSSKTSAYFEEDLENLAKQGVNKLIVDLRNNTGGVTNGALECASYLMPKDLNVMVVKSKSKEDLIAKNTIDGKEWKVVILVNEYTASASEIFTAALKYNNLATVVGKTTFGKGTMQETASLGSFGGLKLTVAEFCGPNGETINGQGIMPDVYIDNVRKQVKDGDFPPLTYEKKFSLGDHHEQITILKEMLAVLGYISSSNTDEQFDMSLYNAVKNFQKENGLFSYGVLDFSTQIAINNMVYEASYLEDTQFAKALEIINAE